MRTQVAIVGAGPAGLLLSHLLHLEGISSIVLEAQSRQHVEQRIRAGVLEQGTVDLLVKSGVGGRLQKEGLIHHGIELRFGGRAHRIDLSALTAGRAITVYAQQEVVKDLIQARLTARGQVFFEVTDVGVRELAGTAPKVRFRKNGTAEEIACDFIAGCDGYHGVSRASVPRGASREYEKVYPFGWLGLLADVPPVFHELIYANTDRGFALCSMRSATRSRFYLQVPLTDKVEQWSDEAFWTELRLRLDPEARERLVTGASLEKSIAPLRSFVAEPMRFGRLFLAGDAAHIVPPTGAKGLNLAASDVKYLANGLVEHYKERSSAGLDHYSDRALRRIWKAERFSWWFTQLMHQFPGEGPIAQKLQEAELDYLVSSKAASSALAENYVGLPL